MIVELSYLISETETVLIENHPKPRVVPRKRISDGSMDNTSILEIQTHNGTHIDVPWHMFQDGMTVTDFEISDFVFDRPVLIRCPKGDRGTITREDLEAASPVLDQADILLIYTGFSDYRRSDPMRYVHQCPSFSVEAARYVVESLEALRCIGVDCLSMENIEEARKTGYPAHKILLGEGRRFFLVEDLNLLPALGKRISQVSVIPLRVIGTDGSPATVLAEVN
jgi:arylformamidase